MNRDVLIGAGVVLAFIVLVNRAKNNQVTESQGGGGGGGGGFGPFGPMPLPPTPPTPPIVPPAPVIIYRDRVVLPTKSPMDKGEVITRTDTSKGGTPTNSFDGYNFNGGLSLWDL